MKRLLNTLYIMTPGTYLSRKGEGVLVRVENETKLHVPIHNLESIVCLGRVLCTPALLALCAHRQVSLSFLSPQGRFLARVTGPVSGNVLLRREQYRRADDPGATAALARAFVIGKIGNCRNVLLRAARDGSRQSDKSGMASEGPASSVDIEQPLRLACAQLARQLETLRMPSTIDVVRGVEGRAAEIYFGVFDHLILCQKDDFTFTVRSRRPPLDNMNALLSFCYTLLVHDVASALETVGLDPAVGFLHRDRPGRPGLALDLMEELRPFLADRLVLSLVNRMQLKGSDFCHTESGAVMMTEEARKKVVTAYQKRKREEIQHPFLGEKIEIGLIPYVQALLLARHLRGCIDGYPPFLWK